MEQLYLLGFTRDLKGVVVATSPDDTEPAYWIAVDEKLLEAIARLRVVRGDLTEEETTTTEATEHAIPDDQPDEPEPEPEVDPVPLPAVGRSRASGRLTTSEIQQFLREGRSVRTVAKAAQVSRAWVERLLEPILTERQGVALLAQRARLHRPRLGRSGVPLGLAVLENLEDRKATIETIEQAEELWDARAMRSGRWRVWVRFEHRGRRMQAEWDFDKSSQALSPRNRLGAELGWRPPQGEPEPTDAAEADEGSDVPDELALPAAAPSGAASQRKAVQRGSTRRSTGRKPTRKPAGRKTPTRKAKSTKAGKRKPAKRGAAKRKPARRPTR